LIADGTAGRITFTSARTNTPAPGDWRGIEFYPSSLDSPYCRLRDCKVEFGGANDSGNVVIFEARPDIRQDSIGYSLAWGIFLGGTNDPFPETLLAHNWFYSNAQGPVGP
jgi:hypothetical protein